MYQVCHSTYMTVQNFERIGRREREILELIVHNDELGYGDNERRTAGAGAAIAPEPRAVDAGDASQALMTTEALVDLGGGGEG